MKTSTTLGELSKALSAAQMEMTAAQFDSKNPHFGSRYASLAAIVEATKPLARNHIAVVQTAEVSRDEKGATVTVATMLSHASGEWVCGETSMKVERDTPQGVGSAITYARRYALSAIAGISADEDDDGEHAESRKPAAKPVKANPTKSAPTVVAPTAKTATSSVASSTSPAGETKKQPKEISEEINIIRSGLKSLGVKTITDMQNAVFSIIERKIEGLTDLNALERMAIMAEIDRQKAMVAADVEVAKQKAAVVFGADA